VGRPASSQFADYLQPDDFEGPRKQGPGTAPRSDVPGFADYARWLIPHTFETEAIEVDRFYTGVISQRNKLAIPIRVMGRRIIELYDAILSGQNAEISVRSTLQRACGYIPYNSNPVSGVPQKFHAFQPISQPGSIFPIVDTSTGVFYVPPGTAAQTTVATKTQGKQSSFFSVGNYLYIGNQEFSKKWDTGAPQGLTNWGINIGSVNNAVGPNGAGTGTDVPVTGGTAWANPGNITANDGVFSTVTLAAPGGSSFTGNYAPGTASSASWTNANAIKVNDATYATRSMAPRALSGTITATNFGFGVPSNATILGISATIIHGDITGIGDIFDNIVQLVKLGAPVGNNEASGVVWGAPPETDSYGGPSDLWGTTWTPADVNSSGFGIQLQAKNFSFVSTETAGVTFMSLGVSYSVPSTATVSDYLEGTNFAFAIAGTSTISGILVEVKGLQPAGNPAQSGLNATLLKLGTPIGSAKSLTLPAANGFVPLGGAGDLWGTTWTPNDVNQINFGVAIQGMNSGGTSASYSVDFVRITLFGTGGPTVALVAGTLTATQGFQYLFAFGNSNDGNISNPTPASTTIKPVAQGVQVSLTASTDPQVNQIRLFRTTDTGTGAVFFELPTSPYPNTTANVVDNAADTALQVTQALVVGTLNFSAPPAGLVNLEWYAGRMWGSVGNLLYYSAGPDNTPMGNGQSNWPPQNVFVLPTQIVKNCALNGGNGMLSVTLDGVHVVQGISNPGFTVNKWLSDVGARQQNAVDTDGSNLYIFTSDRQFLQLSSQGINELSQTISDQTDALDPTRVYVTQHRSGSQDSRVFLTDGAASIFPYNLMMGAWEPVKNPADGGGVGAIGSIEIQPGVFKLLKGATTSGQLILQRDLGTFSDNGTAYPWNAVFGNIPLANPTQLANIESILLRTTSVGSLPTVSVLANDTAGNFVPIPSPRDEPPEANSPAQGYTAKKYYLDAAKVWTQMSHIQVQFSFGAEAAQNEILSWGIFPNQSADQQPGKIPEIQGR
jgi:hypothetical protein